MHFVNAFLLIYAYTEKGVHNLLKIRFYSCQLLLCAFNMVFFDFFFYCLEFCVYPRYNVVALVVQCGLAPHLAGGFVAFVER